MTMTTPRGIRNNNPGNIRWGDPWQGLVAANERTDPDFCQFVDPVWGIRAIARTLITYQDKRRAADGSVIDTLTEIIERWAPPEDNNPTTGYIHAASNITGFEPFELLDLHKYEHVKPIVEAIIRVECGKGPLDTRNSWYSDAVIDEGLARAGVVKEAKEIVGIPVTKETVGATAVASVGIAQVVEVLPTVVQAVENAEADLTSGSWIRITCGLLTIAASILIAWSQVRKYQEGLIA